MVLQCCLLLPISPDERLAVFFEGSFGGEDGRQLNAPILSHSGASIKFYQPLLAEAGDHYLFSSSCAEWRLAANSGAPILDRQAMLEAAGLHSHSLLLYD